MKGFIEGLKHKTGGFSSRKLLALHLMLLLTIIDLEYCYKGDFSAFTTVITIHITGALLALGIITLEEINRFKNGNKDERKETTNIDRDN
jgi:hypothetical protein